MRVQKDVIAFSVAGAALIAASLCACGSKDANTFGGATISYPLGGDSGTIGTNGFASDSGSAGSGPFGTGPTPTCTSQNQCVHGCSGSTASTSITGTVYDPAGKNPLYGVVVYVPSKALSPISGGAACYTCQSLYSGDPIAYDVTDAAGHFTIHGAPDGSNIPLVIQVGKWRRQFTVASVSACATTALPDKTLTLPKNQSEGDLPSMGIATGGADTLECLLRRIGVSASEYTSGPGGTGRVHIFTGDGGSTTARGAPNAYAALWDKVSDLMPYDLVLLTCEGHETTSDGQSPLTTAQQQALFDYAKGGGRAFASHYHYAWFNSGPFAAQNLAQWSAGGQQYRMQTINANIETTLPGGGAFPRGTAMKQWLGNVGALVNGELPIDFARHNAVVTTANTASVPWIVSDTNAMPPNETEYFSFDTPFGVAADQQCGRVVYSDLHVGGASTDYNWDGQKVPPNAVVPDGCAIADLSAQEKALEFMLFDLSGCVTPATQPAGGLPPPK